MIIIGLFLFIGNSFAQSYEELIEKSYDFVDKGDLVSAEESLKAAMRKEPANPLNYALLTKVLVSAVLWACSLLLRRAKALLYLNRSTVHGRRLKD